MRGTATVDSARVLHWCGAHAEKVPGQSYCDQRAGSSLGLRKFRQSIEKSENHDHWWDETKCSWNNMVTRAKHRLLLRHRDELNALHAAKYTERLVLHDQWRADPRWFSLYL